MDWQVKDAIVKIVDAASTTLRAATRYLELKIEAEAAKNLSTTNATSTKGDLR